jgi:hypothetical protein
MRNRDLHQSGEVLKLCRSVAISTEKQLNNLARSCVLSAEL